MNDMTPIKVKDLPAFLAAIEPIARDLMDGDMMAALSKNADRVITATAIGAGVDRAWLEEQTAGVLIDLAARVLEVNADFFVGQAIPRITRAAERIASLTPSGGTSGSPDSSARASDTPT